MMIVIGGCQRLTCVTRVLNSFSHNLKFHRRDDIYIYKKIHTSSAINLIGNARYNNEYWNSQPWCTHIQPTSNKRRSDLPEIFYQTNRNVSIAAKIVEKAPSKIQPYMKLMRIDKPIGKHMQAFILSLFYSLF